MAGAVCNPADAYRRTGPRIRCRTTWSGSFRYEFERFVVRLKVFPAAISDQSRKAIIHGIHERSAANEPIQSPDSE